MALDLTPLASALARLEEGYARYLKDTSDQQIRDGLVQRFEFTYDLSHKMLKRYLTQTAPTPEVVEHMSFPALIRTGSEQGLLRGEWAQWKLYRDKRNITSHTYDEAKALEVVASIPDFIFEAGFLRDRLVERAGTE
ncbi:nucleotidyltransferase substrate binding protein [Novosphingobium sp.]|uniref:nucleotidyltransferase substrate binding protein n=1 Tax=Novosphingobium sp. TaxID=1874826 RepID=UPI003B52294E